MSKLRKRSEYFELKLNELHRDGRFSVNYAIYYAIYNLASVGVK